MNSLRLKYGTPHMQCALILHTYFSGYVAYAKIAAKQPTGLFAFQKGKAFVCMRIFQKNNLPYSHYGGLFFTGKYAEMAISAENLSEHSGEIHIMRSIFLYFLV